MKSRRSAVLAAAVLAALSGGGAEIAIAQPAYWDVNGTTAGSGVSSVTLDWFADNFGSGDGGSWDNVATNWNTDPTGGAGGVLLTNPGAGNTGVFSANDPNLTYVVSIGGGAVVGDGGVTVTAGGLAINQGRAVIAGEGNGGQQHTGVGGTHGFSPSFLNVGSGTFNVNVATGSSLLFGYRFRLPTFKGSATIEKTGGGIFNIFPDQIGTVPSGSQPLGKFTGKYSVLAGQLGLGYGGNQTFENPGTFTDDKLFIDNNAQVRFFQNTSTRTIPANFGFKFGAGGGTLYSAGSAELDGITTANLLATVIFSSKLSGGTASSPVLVTVDSNTLADNGSVTGDGTVLGGIFTLNGDSSATLFAKWLLKNGMVNTNAATDIYLGAVPTAPTSDAITLNGGGLRSNVTIAISTNRGILLGANGGAIRPEPASGGITYTVNSNITGAGALTVYVDRSTGNTVLNGTNTYSGGTFVKGLNGRGALGGLQGNTVSLQGNFSLSDGAKLIFDQTSAGTYAGSISGNGSLTKSNTGVVFFTGSNSYSGTTTVSGGALIATTTAGLPGYNNTSQVNAGSGAAVGGSAGGAGQWLSGDFDTLIFNGIFNSGSALAINVDNANSFTYGSNVTFSAGISKYGAGTLQLTGTNTYSGATSVKGGTLQLATTFAPSTPGALDVSNGAKAVLTPGNNKSAKFSSLSFNTSGQLDINDNKLIVQFGTAASPLAATRAAAIAGRGGTDFGNATWQGTGGIASSAAAPGGIGDGTNAGDGISFAVGYVENSFLPSLGLPSYTEFGGQTVDSGSMLIRFTRGADCNLDGKVNTDDVTVVGALYNNAGSGEWFLGDFDFDGICDTDDVTVLGALYDATAPALSQAQLSAQFGSEFAAAFARGQSMAAVPEPASVALLASAAALFTRRRRRSPAA